jgi:hypothetical protein
MPESESESSSLSSLLSPNAIMAIVTLVGGLFLVSHKLTSQRPARPLSDGTQPLGTQNIESRLWEDPFAAWDKLASNEQPDRTSAGLNGLSDAVRRNIVAGRSNILILAVMVSGQPYAEDQEGRVRIRYAVGAGLASGGYKPVSAEHIGLVARSWPSGEELDDWKARTNAALQIVGTNGSKCERTGCLAMDTNKLRLRVPFEEYEPCEYIRTNEYPSAQTDLTNRYSRVFLAWLDEEYFDDEPAARLALFKSDLQKWPTNIEPKWAIIGPRYSSTLAALLESSDCYRANSNLWQKITNTLHSVQLVLATPTEMDEALLRDTNGVAGCNFDHARAAVSQALSAAGLFNSVTNVACTDRQLAHEALEELSLRGVDPRTNCHDHLVLISEWDTLFSRMVALAFAAEMPSNSEFIEQIRSGTPNWPKNLHRYSYLQGLDGEAAGSEEDVRKAKEKSGRFVATSVEDIAHWQPDANKAEGPAQFDYLARLGDSLAEFDGDLWWNHEHSRVTAVGIIGSDVYDTLLVLQALRERLPDAIFFTSDLDARFWHPDELAWTRNLVVVSGFGLRLKDELQAGVAPFRESAQCAHFLATLYAIGSKKIAGLEPIHPRRFEIGRRGPVDMPTTNKVDPASSPHPEPRQRPKNLTKPITLSLGMLLICLVVLSKPFRRLAVPSDEYCGEALRIAEEDIGGETGAGKMYERLETNHPQWSGDTLAEWLFPAADRQALAEARQAKSQAKTDEEEKKAEERLSRESQEALKGLLGRCNRLVFMPVGANGDAERLADIVRQTHIMNPEQNTALLRGVAKLAQKKNLSAWDARKSYEAVDQILEQLKSTKERGDDAACSARTISLSTFRRRQWRAVLFWLAALFVGTGLGLGICWALRDTYGPNAGEPFNFHGTSAWPAEFIRFVALALNVVLIFTIQHKMGQGRLDITRRYRFGLKLGDSGEGRRRKIWSWFWPEDPPMIDGDVDANELWNRYLQARGWLPRLIRVAASVLIYFVFACALVSLGREPFRPIRGALLLQLDKPLLILSGLSFLFMTFWMIDGAAISAWFIGRLSQARTRYPEATLSHFKNERAIKADSLIEEWIDLQLIADLTEPIGRVVYWPFIALLLMLVARNSWWDRWPWHWPLVLVFVLNLGLAAASYLILQRAAKHARALGVRNLKAKVNQKESEAAKSVAEHEASQAEKLLDEISNLRRGAFVPFSKGPLVGGLLVNSSGLVLVELLAQLYFK